jgi:hypothetical protein
MDAHAKQDRRRLRKNSPRIPVAFQVEGLRSKGYIKNVSQAGLFIRSTRLPGSRDPVNIVFADARGRLIHLNGTVRWTTAEVTTPRPITPGFGMHIENPSAQYLEFFQQLLDAP